MAFIERDQIFVSQTGRSAGRLASFNDVAVRSGHRGLLTKQTPHHIYKQILLLGELPQTLDASRNDTKQAVGKGRCHLKTSWWMKNDTQRKVSNLHGFRVNFWGIAGLAVRRRWKVCGQALFPALFYVFSEASWNAQTGCLVLISFIRTDPGCLAKVLRMPTHPAKQLPVVAAGKALNYLQLSFTTKRFRNLLFTPQKKGKSR